MDLVTIVAALTAFGAAALAVDRPSSSALARTSFIVAAVLTAYLLLIWGAKTEMTPIARMAVTSLASAALGVALVETLRWAAPSTPKKAAPQTASRTSGPAPILTAPAENRSPRKTTSTIDVQQELAREQLRELRARQASERKEAEQVAAKKLQDEESLRRQRISSRVGDLVDRLRSEYINGRDGNSAALLAGTEAVPDEFMNSRLRELGYDWTYTASPAGGYTLSPGSSAFKE